MVIVNGAEAEAFAGTVAVDGTDATEGLELARLMVKPPAGASPARFTTFVVVNCPLVALADVKVSELIWAASSVRVALAMAPLTPLRLAKIATVVEEATAAVLMVKLLETVAPADTVTDAGTEANAGFELDRLKTSPPAGAGLVRIKLFGNRELPP